MTIKAKDVKNLTKSPKSQYPYIMWKRKCFFLCTVFPMCVIHLLPLELFDFFFLKTTTGVNAIYIYIYIRKDSLTGLILRSYYIWVEFLYTLILK